MLTVYNILTYIAAFHIKLIAIFNAKMKLGVSGRKETFNILKSKVSSTDKTIWFHCASLGEYEQGLPVFEDIRKHYPNFKIVLSFFSPSGFEIRKNTPIADVVVYLPLDTKKNAQTFVDLVHPELVLFVKYEIWPNYLKVLKSKGIETLLISALFRKEQIHFKWHGGLMRNALSKFEHIFVQDKASKTLLESINLNNVSVSGDTRFDRVSNQLKVDNNISGIENFKGGSICVVCGSTWPEDERLLTEYINTYKRYNTKFIIAPHNIKNKQIEQLQNQLHVKSILYSEVVIKDISKYNILIIDCIGLLSKIYSYADVAYVGGAVGKTGLHNILEPAVFGVPIVIGENHGKFPEARALKTLGGLISIKNGLELKNIFNKLVHDEEIRLIKGAVNQSFITKNRGAVIQIMDYIRK